MDTMDQMVMLRRNIGSSWVDDYSLYFHTLGIEAKKIQENDPEFLDCSIPGEWLGVMRIGTIIIEGRNIHQLILLRGDGKSQSFFSQLFVVRAQVGENADQLKAHFTTPMSLRFRRGPYQFIWKGESLAESLNRDSILNGILTSYQRDININADKKRQCVTILHQSEYHPDILDQKHLEAIDRIAEHILRFMQFSP